MEVSSLHFSWNLVTISIFLIECPLIFLKLMESWKSVYFNKERAKIKDWRIGNILRTERKLPIPVQRSWPCMHIRCIGTSLTPNRPLIQLWCAQSKLNMDENCSLNIHLWYVDIPQKVLLKSLHAQKWSFLLLNL